MNKRMQQFLDRYKKTPNKIKCVDLYIIFTFFQFLILTAYAYACFSLKNKFLIGSILLVLGNITFAVTIREQVYNKKAFHQINREKILFDFVLCSFLLHFGVFSFIRLN